MNLTTNAFPWVKWRGLVPLGIFLAAILGVITVQLYAPGGFKIQRAQTISSPQSLAAAQTADQQQAVQLQLLKTLPHFGFENLLADWTFLNFLQYFGDEALREKLGYQLNDDYFDVITALDPRWVEIYIFLSTSVSFYQGQPETAVKFMERGTNALSPGRPPEAWLVWRIKAIDQLLLVGDTAGAVHSLEMAANWAENTRYKDFAPQFRQAAQTLKDNPDNLLIRMNAWLSVYSQSTDKRVQARAMRELIDLGVKSQVDAEGNVKFILPADPQ
ncbi:MAG: hypothetical protein ACRC8A_02315 [Microcoleaceae cyanobacterium]